jgi:prevent-host-death family protein
MQEDAEVGVRQLKAQLSRWLKHVQQGRRVTITDRGKPVAVLAPVDPKGDTEWAWRLVAEGRASWGGGKPRGLSTRIPSRGRSAAQMIIEDRR